MLLTVQSPYLSFTNDPTVMSL